MPSTLYKMLGSPPARAVIMLIEILGLNIDQKDLNPLLREQDAPEFKKKNPMKTIPILDEGDFWLADSHAIIIYLMEKYAKPEHSSLYPADSRKRATINQRLFFDCGVLFTSLRNVMAPTYNGSLSRLSKYMIRTIEGAYKVLEEYLSQTKYMADDVITIADISIVSTMESLNGLHPIDEKRFPKLAQWFANMNQQEYCKNINIPGGAQHVAGLKAFMDYNEQNKKSKL